MKIKINKVIEEGMIAHLGHEGDIVSTKGRGKARYLECSCELIYYFEDENGDEWSVVTEDRFPTIRLKKTSENT